MKKINGIMIQYFEWYLDSSKKLWNKIIEDAPKLANLGVTAMWLPPAYKGTGGKDEVGYAVYDVYDLGEFDQKGSIETKYGSKDEYIRCIEALKKAGIESYADIVLNHKIGADGFQTIPANKVDWGNHNELQEGQEYVKVATKFTFPGRKDKYSSFKWNWTHFDGIDYNEATKENAIFKFKDKSWGNQVDEEYGNFDYLMGADLDFENQEVVEECTKWGEWYLRTTRVDGFRLDAVKHINSEFYRDWIRTLRKNSQKSLFTVGEYWSGDIRKLHRYITETEGEIALFDVPLHYHLYQASKDENYDLSRIFEETLVKDNPSKAVTFVENHDTQPGQALESFVETWFKASAYSLILLRQDGYPCVFYGDYYGIPHDNVESMEKEISNFMVIRKEKAYGVQHDYFDHPNYIGWTLEGDDEHKDSGVAVVITNRGEGEKWMYVGKQHAGEQFVDSTGKFQDIVVINDEGMGCFKVREKSVSVWVKK